MPMLESIKFGTRLAELRVAIADFPGDGDAGDLAKLNREFLDTDVRLASAKIVESADADAARAAGDLDAGQRELGDIGGRLRFRRYVEASVEGRGADGAEGEYNAGAGMGARQFPLAMLAPVRSRAVTTVDGQASQSARWLDRLFAESSAQRIGITTESVPAGESVYMTTSAGATGAQRGKGQGAVDAPWSIAVKTLSPKRGAVHGSYAIQDSARLPGLSDALRRDFSMALMDSVDQAIFLGDTTANPNDGDVVGLATYAGLTEKTLTQAGKILGATVLGAFAELVDGYHASDMMDLRVVVSTGAYQEWLSTIVSNAENQTISQFLTASRLAWASRGGLADDTDADSWAAFVGRARGVDLGWARVLPPSGMPVR